MAKAKTQELSIASTHREFIEFVCPNELQHSFSAAADQFLKYSVRLVLRDWHYWEENVITAEALFQYFNYTPHLYPCGAIVYLNGFTPESECVIYHQHSRRKKLVDDAPAQWIKTYSLAEIQEQLAPYAEMEMSELCPGWLAATEQALERID